MIKYETLVQHLQPAHQDERGYILNILSGIDINHIAIITQAKGTIRGNHYHYNDDQYIYIVSGRMRSHSRPADNPDAPVQILDCYGSDLLYCPPGVVHAYEALSNNVVFLNIDNGVRTTENYEETTVPCVILSKET